MPPGMKMTKSSFLCEFIESTNDCISPLLFSHVYTPVIWSYFYRPIRSLMVVASLICLNGIKHCTIIYQGNNISCMEAFFPLIVVKITIAFYSACRHGVNWLVHEMTYTAVGGGIWGEGRMTVRAMMLRVHGRESLPDIVKNWWSGQPGQSLQPQCNKSMQSFLQQAPLKEERHCWRNKVGTLGCNEWDAWTRNPPCQAQLLFNNGMEKCHPPKWCLSQL